MFFPCIIIDSLSLVQGWKPRVFTISAYNMMAAQLIFTCIILSNILWIDSFDQILSVTSWQSILDNLTIPEHDYLRRIQDSIFKKKTKNGVEKDFTTALSFSGGGSRSYIASIGYLAALHELHLLDDIDYIVGVSGGSWATAAYTFSQLEVSDDELLGQILFPEDISRIRLNDMDENCLRKLTNVPALSTMNSSAFQLWIDSVSRVYLEPIGVKPGQPFTWNSDILLSIYNRNPSLKKENVSFILPRSAAKNGPRTVDDRPFPIFGITLIGPANVAPYKPSNRDYSLLESTPIATGVLKTRTPTVSYHALNSHETQNASVGGLIETFAFGGCCPSTMERLATSSLIEINNSCTCASKDLEKYFDLATAIGASSYYDGCYAAASSSPSLRETAGSLNYWSPTSSIGSSNTDYYVADGGGLQVDNLISLLQRKVDRIILFCSTSIPLQPSTKWNASDFSSLSENDIDFDIPSFFGVVPSDYYDNKVEVLSYDLTKSQVFPADDWVPLALALQDAQQRGSGIITTTQHTTVSNEFYGIPAGRNVQITWVYLGRLSQWEGKLSADMKRLVVPPDTSDDLGSLIQSGPFMDFPNYKTSFANINFEQANLLADLAGWSILKNENLFKEVLSAK